MVSLNSKLKSDENHDVYLMFKPPYEVDIFIGKGGHGGVDPVMLEQIFSRTHQRAHLTEMLVIFYIWTISQIDYISFW